VDGWLWFKQVVNVVNLSTVGGLVVAGVGRAKVTRGPRGLWFATGYRIGFPKAGAFTIGNVVLTRHDLGYLERQPALVRHEERHSWQYVCMIGMPMLPLYGLAACWSWIRTGDCASRNPFERLAGLVDGGYRERQPRSPVEAFRRRARPARPREP
jgi:hypothetical protein